MAEDDLEELAAWYESHSTAADGSAGDWVEVEDSDDPTVLRTARVPRSVAARLLELAAATGREASEIAGDLIVRGMGVGDAAAGGHEPPDTQIP